MTVDTSHSQIRDYQEHVNCCELFTRWHTPKSFVEYCEGVRPKYRLSCRLAIPSLPRIIFLLVLFIDYRHPIVVKMRRRVSTNE